MRALSELRAASLIMAEEDGETMRFRMLETLRQYAAERLEAQPFATVVRERHAAWFLRFAEDAEARQRGADQEQWLRQLDRELDNVRAVLADPAFPEMRARLAAALPHFWTVRGLAAEGLRCVRGILAEPGVLPPAVCAGLNNAAGILALWTGDCDQAQHHFTKTLEYFREQNDARNIAGMLSNLGVTAGRAGRPRDARMFFEESLQLYDGLELHSQRAIALGNLGVAAMELGDMAEARRAFEDALALQRGAGDQCGMAVTLLNLAELSFFQHEAAEALQRAEASLEISRRLKLLPYMASSATLLGALRAARGDGWHAARWLAMARVLGGESGLALSDSRLAALFESETQRVRAELPEMEFASAWAEGQRLAQRWAAGSSGDGA
jgi:tetratricopeptide (TPR) repeat protein